MSKAAGKNKTFVMALCLALKERANCYDSLGKKILAADDRRALDKISQVVNDEMFGNGK